MSRKLKYALASIAAAIVPGIAAPGARAINNPPDEAGNCVIQGTMHTSGVGVLANSGTYSFDSFIDNCTETDSTDASETNPDVSINLTSTGSFNNSVCGTSGEAGCAWNGTATVFGSTDPSEFPVVRRSRTRSTSSEARAPSSPVAPPPTKLVIARLSG